MKYGAAVVIGALGMFASGYMLGYTTAVPDILRESALDVTELGSVDEQLDSLMQGDVSIDLPESDTALDPSMGMDPLSAEEADKMAAAEMEQLKRLVVPLLTDEEIKKIREEIAKEPAGPVAESP